MVRLVSSDSDIPTADHKDRKGTMLPREEWRDDQRERTRDILEQVDITAFMFDLSGMNKGCPLDHPDGRHGYITLQDALAENWNILDFKTDRLIGSYESIDALIEQGWKVSNIPSTE